MRLFLIRCIALMTCIFCISTSVQGESDAWRFSKNDGAGWRIRFEDMYAKDLFTSETVDFRQKLCAGTGEDEFSIVMFFTLSCGACKKILQEFYESGLMSNPKIKVYALECSPAGSPDPKAIRENLNTYIPEFQNVENFKVYYDAYSIYQSQQPYVGARSHYYPLTFVCKGDGSRVRIEGWIIGGNAKYFHDYITELGGFTSTENSDGNANAATPQTESDGTSEPNSPAPEIPVTNEPDAAALTFTSHEKSYGLEGKFLCTDNQKVKLTLTSKSNVPELAQPNPSISVVFGEYSQDNVLFSNVVKRISRPASDESITISYSMKNPNNTVKIYVLNDMLGLEGYPARQIAPS